MTKLTIKPAVRAALCKAFPKPALSAARILDKYVGVLAHLVDTALQQPRSAYMRKKGLYHIPVTTLQQTGQLGPKRIRLHKWLADNGYAMIEIIVQGTNLTGKPSLVALTQWVTIDDELTDKGEIKQLNDDEIEKFLASDGADGPNLAKRLYPEMLEDRSLQELKEIFDFVEVDAKSLENYMTWLITAAKLIKQAQKQSYLSQAKTILAISKQFDNLYPQRKVKSDFGRTYYAGISVQNVNKDLRRAMLGDCWEYDVRSSVIAWKMSLAKEYLQQAGIATDAPKYFSATVWLLTEKSIMFKQIQAKTFAADSNVPEDLQLELIKQAMTAICFGARLQQQGWKSENGVWKNPAIVDIIKNAEERKRFMSSRDVKDFVKEQNELDNYIFDYVKKNTHDLPKKSVLLSNNRLNKAKTVAYLYQNCETQAMNVAYEFLASKKIQVIAKIHDAFVVRKKLSGETKVDLQMLVQQETKNEYWRLGEKQIERWGNVMSVEETQRIAEHKAFIAAEELYVKKMFKHNKL